MAALTASAPFRFLGSPTKRVLKAAATGYPEVYYGGALVFHKFGTGGVTPIPAATWRLAGICCFDQTAAADGDPIEVYLDGYFLLPLGGAITAADEGDILIQDIGTIQSDNPADTASVANTTLAVGANSDIVIGTIVEALTASMWIQLMPRRTIKTDAGML